MRARVGPQQEPKSGLWLSRLQGWGAAGGYICAQRCRPPLPPVAWQPRGHSPVVLVLQLGVGVVQGGAPGVEVVAAAGRRRFQAVPRRVHGLEGVGGGGGAAGTHERLGVSTQVDATLCLEHGACTCMPAFGRTAHALSLKHAELPRQTQQIAQGTWPSVQAGTAPTHV